MLLDRSLVLSHLLPCQRPPQWLETPLIPSLLHSLIHSFILAFFYSLIHSLFAIKTIQEDSGALQPWRKTDSTRPRAGAGTETEACTLGEGLKHTHTHTLSLSLSLSLNHHHAVLPHTRCNHEQELHRKKTSQIDNQGSARVLPVSRFSQAKFTKEGTVYTHPIPCTLR